MTPFPQCGLPQQLLNLPGSSPTCLPEAGRTVGQSGRHHPSVPQTATQTILSDLSRLLEGERTIKYGAKSQSMRPRPMCLLW